MTFSCFLLGKVSPSYTYIGACQVEGDATVHNVTQNVQRLASMYHEWELADVEIKMYQVLLSFVGRSRLPLTPPQPIRPLGAIKNETRGDLEKLLLDTVNDEYLTVKCSRILSNSKLRPSPGCLIATGW